MKKILSTLLLLAIIFSLCACGNSPQKPAGSGDAPSAETQIIKDAHGREVTVPLNAQKIVALSNTPRLVVYLGLKDRVVGYSGMDPQKVTPVTAYAYAAKETWASVPIVGTDAGGNTDYYPEMIIKAAPDVIFCNYAEDVADGLQKQTGIPVVSVAMGSLFGEDYNESLRTIAKVCGVEQRAEDVIKFVNDCLADLKNRTEKINDSEKPTVLSAAATFKGAHGIEGVRIKDSLLAAVSANNIAKDLEVKGNATAVEVEKEQILKWNAEYIFCDYSGVKLVKEDAKANPDFYAQLDAYKNGKIYQHPSSTSCYSNLEIPLANAYFIGSIIYPKAFEDVELNAKANEIFKFFLGVDNYMDELNKFGASYGPIDFSK